jgi:hypothetical protein
MVFGVKPEQFFYEDTYRNTQIELSSKEIHAIVEPLNSLLAKLRCFDFRVDEQEKLKIYFLEKYNNARSVSLIKFYEDYYRDYKLYFHLLSDHSANIKKKKAPGNRYSKNRYEKYQSIFNDNKQRQTRLMLHSKFVEKFKHGYAHLVNNGEIRIDQNFINQTIKGIYEHEEFTNMGNSFGAFIQLIHNDSSEKRQVVVNATFSGYGKLYSRFMHLFDHKIRSSLIEYNKPVNTDLEYHVENVDASYFNANIHPTLMPYEIWSPSSQNSLDREHQIPITDIIVKYSDEDDRLHLINKQDGKRIFVFDLCFQSETGRSRLFQLLNYFSKSPVIPIKSFIEIIRNIERERQKEQEIVTIPRVNYENNLILSRKRWEIPLYLLPDPNKINTRSEFAIEINNFRQKYDIPHEVFITINSKRWRKNQPKSKYSKDDYKPQYINFLWPQYINLLIHHLRKKPEKIIIEEMLPGSKNMLKINGKGYVSELLINWYER